MKKAMKEPVNKCRTMSLIECTLVIKSSSLSSFLGVVSDSTPVKDSESDFPKLDCSAPTFEFVCTSASVSGAI